MTSYDGYALADLCKCVFIANPTKKTVNRNYFSFMFSVPLFIVQLVCVSHGEHMTELSVNRIKLNNEDWSNQQNQKQNKKGHRRQNYFGDDAEAGVFLKFGWEF